MSQIVTVLREADRSKNLPEIWRDWTEATALALENSTAPRDAVYEAREDRYKKILARYPAKALDKFAAAYAELVNLYERCRFEDHLGPLYMEHVSKGEKGQFFSPYSICLMMARAQIDSEAETKRNIRILDCAAGSGATLIAALQVCSERGIPWQSRCEVYADDLDWTCCHMAMIQLSTIGAKAVVRQGDSLLNDFPPGRSERAWVSPMARMPLVGRPLDETTAGYNPAPVAPTYTAPPPLAATVAPGKGKRKKNQLKLF